MTDEQTEEARKQDELLKVRIEDTRKKIERERADRKIEEIQFARERAFQDVKMFQSNDWELKEETPQYFLLKKRTDSVVGHLLVFLITGWFTFGTANIIYWLASRKTKKIIK